MATSPYEARAEVWVRDFLKGWAIEWVKHHKEQELQREVILFNTYAAA